MGGVAKCENVRKDKLKTPVMEVQPPDPESHFKDPRIALAAELAPA